jgi:hypothetical protein
LKEKFGGEAEVLGAGFHNLWESVYFSSELLKLMNDAENNQAIKLSMIQRVSAALSSLISSECR